MKELSLRTLNFAQEEAQVGSIRKRSRDRRVLIGQSSQDSTLYAL